MSTLLGICGSLRAGSLNRTLLREAARIYGAPMTEGDLRLPLYDGDLEAAEGIPAAVQTLADQIAQAKAVLISTPEYNKGISGVLKNALDWISRTKGAPLAGKPVAILSATAGRSGGERAQYNLRLSLVPFRADILPAPEVLIGGASGAFDENGHLTDERSQAMLAELMETLRAKAATRGFSDKE